MERLVKHLKLVAKGCSALRYEIRVFEQKRPVKIVRFSLTLVMGAENERYYANDFAGDRVLYLKEWNETKFTATVMVMAIENFTADTNHYRRSR